MAVNLLAPLGERYGAEALAGALRRGEELGYRLVRVDAVDDRLCAWIDWQFAPSWLSSEVRDGSVWAPRKVLARLIDAGGVPAADAAALPSTDSIEHKMTPRELEVLHLLMAGKSNRHIASAMHIDEVTVKAHLGRMLRKTGSSNRVELTLRAMDERKGRSAAPPGQ